MSLDEVKRTIRQGTRAAEEAKATIERAVTEVTDAARLARATLHDSRHREVEDGLRRLAEARHEMTLTLRRLAAGRKQARTYLDIIG
jgi:hypothetical protein